MKMTQPPIDRPGPQPGGQPPAYPPPYPGHGYPAYAPPVRMYESAKGLAVAAAVLAGLGAFIEVVDVPLAWLAAEQFEDAAARGIPSSEVITAFDVMGLPTFGVYVAAWIVSALWLSRARTNSEVLNPRCRHKRSAGWAWFGWIVPVVGFWFPYQYVRDVRLATVTEERRYSSVVGWWWAMWLASQQIGLAGGLVVMPPGSDAPRFGLLAPIEGVAAVLAIAALVGWLRIIRQVTEDQNAVAQGRPIASTV
jgi:Domain of unknown function (DUF4328)